MHWLSPRFADVSIELKVSWSQSTPNAGAKPDNNPKAQTRTMLAVRLTCALARVSYMTSTRAKAQNTSNIVARFFAANRPVFTLQLTFVNVETRNLVRQ
jgi:hypothetical protein